MDFTSLLLVLFLVMSLQPVLMGRWFTVRRQQTIRSIEKAHGTRVITMIHRQEKRSLFGFAQSRYIDLEDAQTISRLSRKRRQTFPSIWYCTPRGAGAGRDADRPGS